MEQKKWTIVARDECSLFPHFGNYIAAATSRRYSELIDFQPKPALIMSRDRRIEIGFQMESWVAEAKKVLSKLEDEKFFRMVVRKSLKTIDITESEALKIFATNMQQRSDEQLLAHVKELNEKYLEMSIWGHLINAADFDHFMLTKRLMSILKWKTKDKSIDPNDAFSILTTHTEMNPFKRQELDFLEIASEYEKSPAEKTSRMMYEHKQKYDWIQFRYDGPAIADLEYFRNQIISEKKEGIDHKMRLQEMQKKDKQTEKKQKALGKELSLTKDESYWFSVARKFMFLKAYRKDIVFRVARLTYPLFSEIAIRLNISPLQAKSMTEREIQAALAGDKNTDDIVDRERFQAVLIDSGNITIFCGEKAEEYERQIGDPPRESDDELSGNASSMGHAKGRVKIVNYPQDMAKMEKGDVLVSSATNPDLMPAIRKAAAIVTDEGGITCHAAIVSRELGIPCIVGTKNATQVFSDGDIVEVDTKAGKVRRVK